MPTTKSTSTSVAVRRPNFSNDEKAAIVDGVAAHHEKLFGKFSPILSDATKEDLWLEILENVNSKSSAVPPRTVQEIKKKYQALKSEVKGVASQRKREMTATGGGQVQPEKPLTEIQEKLLQTIPLVQIEGIPGGIDVSRGN